MHCRHAGVCGGCGLLHLSYPDQLAGKEASLRRLLGPFLPPTRQPLFIPVESQAEAPEHFRHKVSFVFAPAPTGRGLVMGHYQRGSRRVVAVDDCPVHSARGNTIAFALRDHLQRAGISAAGPTLDGILRHLIVRTTSDERQAVAMLVVTRNDKSLRAPIRAFLESAERPDGFFVNVHDEDSPYMVGERTLKIDGVAHVREQVGGISYLISPTAFFQTNTEAAAVLQSYVVDAVAGARRVLDLYCGSGLFSLPIAAAGARTLGVEENRQAIDDAALNARLNHIPTSRVRFIAARVEDAVRSASREPWDAVILDPPRQGCSDQVLEAVFQEMAPPRVVYVSCNPESLAAELPGIVQCGYEVDELRAVDMFPHTEHVEAVVRLRLA
ncbi:MAG: 23S rRNA (uracil(1939)-C(5))-methyltransferase RlmD [Vicinamibacterales bacterium]